MGFESMNSGKIARMIVQSVAGIKPGEVVCLVADTKTLPYAEAVANASVAAGAETTVCIMTPRSRDREEPPPPIAAAMKNSPVVIAIVTANLRGNQTWHHISHSGARSVMLYDMSEEVFCSPAMAPNYELMHAETRHLADLLEKTSQVRLVSAEGAELKFSIAGRKALCAGGIIAYKSDTSTGLPTGEAAVAPIEGTAEGVVVIDHAMRGVGKLLSPIKLTIAHGKVQAIEGKEQAMRLREILAESDENATNIAEFAMGTNPNSRMLGNVPEDKKKRGTVHIGLGNNKKLGGSIYSKTHLDGIILKPSVWLDGQEIIKQGELISV